VVEVRIPSLASRREDVPLLAEHFLRRYAAKNSKVMRGFSDEAAKVLENYAWPGNVRELEHAVERAVVLCRSEMIEVGDLPEAIGQRLPDRCLAAQRAADRLRPARQAKGRPVGEAIDDPVDIAAVERGRDRPHQLDRHHLVSLAHYGRQNSLIFPQNREFFEFLSCKTLESLES